jgi:hypothetical protein
VGSGNNSLRHFLNIGRKKSAKIQTGFAKAGFECGTEIAQ